MANRWGNKGNSKRLFSGAPKSLPLVTAALKSKDACSLGGKLWQHSYDLDSILKSRDITLPTMICLVKAMVFPVVMYGCELDYKESWAPKNWCFWTVVLEKTLECPLDWKEIQPVNPQGDQSWIFKNWCWSCNSYTSATWCEEQTHWKRPRCWERLKTRRKGRQRMRRHHWLDGHEFEQAPGVGDGQGSLACCSPWGHKKSDTSVQLNWTES